MMKLGAFSFGIHTAAYHEFKRNTEYSWGSQGRFGQMDALQYTGPGADTITLQGVILTAYKGGTRQLDQLRSLGAEGVPQILVSGRGAIFGLWVIDSIQEGQTVFAAGGLPLKQEFTVALRKYGDGLII